MCPPDLPTLLTSVKFQTLEEAQQRLVVDPLPSMMTEKRDSCQERARHNLTRV